MTGTLRHNHIAGLTDMFKGRLDIGNLLLISNFAVDELFRISSRNNHRTHVIVIQMMEVESFSNQAHIFVHANGFAGIGLDLDVLLADGFDESYLIKALLKTRHDGERCGSFTDVLFGGSDEDRALISTVGQALPIFCVDLGGIMRRGGVAIGLWVRISK